MPHRVPRREQPAVRRHAGPRLPRLHRRSAAAGGPAPPPGAGRRGDGDRDRKRLLPADRRAVEGVPPARRPGAGDSASPRSAGARRADRGTRPEPARRDPPVDRGARASPPRDLRARPSPWLDPVRAAPAGRHPRGTVPPAHAGGSLTMRATWTIARRELKALFDQPTAYILLVVFIAVNGFLCFRQLDLYGVASLRPMFDFLPWVLLFLVPAVTMRALAEDARSGTLEVVLAQPISELELLLGKYVGQVLFLWLALGITLTIPLGLALGTGPQVGILIAQYVGAALLLLGLAGVGVWASSVTRNQVTAFILAVTV